MRNAPETEIKNEIKNVFSALKNAQSTPPKSTPAISEAAAASALLYMSPGK